MVSTAPSRVRESTPNTATRCIVRFENHLDENPLNLDRQDFGSPDYSALIHLHNGHTAPESDGNPHYSMRFGPLHEGYHGRAIR